MENRSEAESRVEKLKMLEQIRTISLTQIIEAMKTPLKKLTFTLAIALATTFSTVAQTTHLRQVQLEPYNKLQVSLDAQVILLKSGRNHVTLVGDSSYIAGMPVMVEDGTLVFNYKAEPETKLAKVVIEYKNLDHATTGGVGTYYFHNLKEEKLVVFNPYANVILTGNTDKIRLISQEGVTDVTKLTANQEIMHIGDAALLVSNTVKAQ